MTAFLDASLVVRYLVGDPPEMAACAARVIEGEESLLLAPLSLAEACYVLQTVYNLPRPSVVEALIRLVNRENIRIHGLARSAVVEALHLCLPSKRVSVEDALLWAQARQENLAIYTFDKKFPGRDVDLRLLNR